MVQRVEVGFLARAELGLLAAQPGIDHLTGSDLPVLQDT
jgi:hypothetical protein